jgi:hypothetical protein
MRINSRKIQKIVGRVWSAPKRIFETFALMNTKMHRHECNTRNFLFDLENQTKAFFLYYISCKENKCWKILVLREIIVFIIFPIHILKLEISGCDKSTPLKWNLVPRFEERRNKEKGDKQEHCCQGR